MNKRFDSALMLRIQVLEAERRYKSAETWQHRGDLPYKLSCVLFIVAAAVMLLMNLMFISGAALRISLINEDFNNITNAAEKLTSHRNNIAIVGILSVFLAAALVLFIFKRFMIPLILTGISAVSANVFFFNLLKTASETNTSVVSEVNDYIPKFILRHLIPGVIALAAMGVVFLIARRDNLILRRGYSKASDWIYEVHRKRLEEAGEDHRMMSPDEWTELVAEYSQGEFGVKKRSK